LTLEAYHKHKQSKAATAPLTEREEEIQRLRKEEARGCSAINERGGFSGLLTRCPRRVPAAVYRQNGADIGITTKKAHVHGVSFPVTDEARAAIEAFGNGEVNYVQLVRARPQRWRRRPADQLLTLLPTVRPLPWLRRQGIDIEKETIILFKSATVDAGEIAALTPEANPRYHFFRYHHAFLDTTYNSIIFIYSCPMKSKVKERMLYSSCKASVITVGQELGVTAEKVSEVSDAVDLTENFIFEELHPRKPDEKKTFKKPMRPGRMR